jgi:quinol monooxygenase YgiN
MVHVIAEVRVKPGNVDEFMKIFKENVPLVRAEKGCIQYVPTVDVNADLPPQIMDENVVTIVEAWESLDNLHAHLASPHMLAYREKVSGVVENVTIRVLREA